MMRDTIRELLVTVGKIVMVGFLFTIVAIIATMLFWWITAILTLHGFI